MQEYSQLFDNGMGWSLWRQDGSKRQAVLAKLRGAAFSFLFQMLPTRLTTGVLIYLLRCVGIGKHHSFPPDVGSPCSLWTGTGAWFLKIGEALGQIL